MKYGYFRVSLALFPLLLLCVSATPPAEPPAVKRVEVVPRWQLRSKHFVYGMPVPTDDRHRMVLPSGREVPGLSVLVDEGFVIGHYDRLKVPAWVCTRWTTDDYRRSEAETYNARYFRDDEELPNYAIGGTSLNYATSGMQRGHMARQQDNKAWGSDNVDEGCEMSNIVPQSAALNNGVWNEIEEEHRAVVANPASGINAVWIISGPIFAPGVPAETVGHGIGVPDACYKVIAWFDHGRFTARAFIVGQTDTDPVESHYLTTVDAVESATGLDFFPALPDPEENRLEAEHFTSVWN